MKAVDLDQKRVEMMVDKKVVRMGVRSAEMKVRQKVVTKDAL